MKSHLALLLISVLSSMMGLAATASARPVIDCPLRDAPYSVDSPLIDVLLKPEAKAAVDREVPTLLQHFPPMFASTTAPTFSAIMTPRLAAAFKGMPEEALDRVNNALTTLPVTDSDREARCARYDNDLPQITIPTGAPRLLLFQKITGFRDAPSVEAATRALQAMAERQGWALVVTDKGGSIEPATLKKFDAVIWNNVSGDVLTLTQRAALKNYIERGGGFVGFHGSGGDPAYFWDWYADTLIGARFEGHPMAPQFQDARITVEDGNGIGHNLAPGWDMKDEWYSFKTSPRAAGAHVIATLDEASYSPKGMGGQDLRMGDHPIAWQKCIGDGRSFYTAIGHLPESYAEPHVVKLLEQGIVWAAGRGETRCRDGKEAAQGTVSSTDRGPALIGAALRSTDLERSIKYYTDGLGMVVARKLILGHVTEVFFAFAGRVGQPGILIFRDDTPGNSPPVDHGNAADRVMLRIPDVAAIAARLAREGYPAGDIHDNGNVKVLNIKDPDGSAFELVEVPDGEVKLKGSAPP